MLTRFIKIIILTLTIGIAVLSSGCNTYGDNNKLAYISSREGLQHQRTFDELNIGKLFDFNLKLVKADKTWVDIWLEAYEDGILVEPFPVTKLSYGFHPKEVSSGEMGLGVINTQNAGPLFFLYSEGVRVGPISVDNTELFGSEITSWAYAINKGTFSLESGEEMILAVYRGNNRQMRSAYNYQDSDAIEEMMNENKTVLLLKIKVEERSK